jgi:phage anti-repressor protein
MDFKTFLIKYTTINTKFIEDFHNIIKEDYFDRYYDFLIDSELLRDWLKISIRKEYVSNIKKNYKINVDFIIKKIENTKGMGSGGHNRELVILTPECAKKICLITKSKIGNEVRQYFIDIELAFYKFKNYIIDGLNKKIDLLEINQKPKINITKGIIYVFRALNSENATLYKIGRTINSKKRFNSHNSPLANDIEVIMIFETDNINQLEICVKNYMKQAQYRKYKEIYKVDIDIIRKIIKDCDTKIKQINQLINKKNKKINGGGAPIITENDQLYLLIPNI